MALRPLARPEPAPTRSGIEIERAGDVGEDHVLDDRVAVGLARGKVADARVETPVLRDLPRIGDLDAGALPVRLVRLEGFGRSEIHPQTDPVERREVVGVAEAGGATQFVAVVV